MMFAAFSLRFVVVATFCVQPAWSLTIQHSKKPESSVKNHTTKLIFTEWTWIAGNKSCNQPSNISYLGKHNYPGSRSGNAFWSDGSEHTWIFGGKGFDDDIDVVTPKVLNDLWRYDIRNNKWTLLTEERHGWNHEGVDKDQKDVPAPRYNAVLCGKKGKYLVLFGGRTIKNEVLSDTWLYFFHNSSWIQLLHLQSHPSARYEMASWCLASKTVIFSGANGKNDLYDDIWVFDLKVLKWHEVEIEKIVFTDSSLTHNYPSPRNGAITWVSSNDSLYMFGGNVIKKAQKEHIGTGFTSDLWRLDLSLDPKWAFVSGYTHPGHVSIYGSLGHGDTETIPSSRKLSLSWVDLDNNLWMFGGEGIDYIMPKFYDGDKKLSDLWKFDINDKAWNWMGGLTKGEGKAIYGDLAKPSLDNLPGPRLNAATWVHNRTFYLFGGDGHDVYGKQGQLNDVWIFNCLTTEFQPLKDVTFVLPFTSGILFIICFSGVMCVSFLICLAVFVKKCLDLPYPSPSRSPQKNYDVKYSPLNTEAVEFS